jgi:hypothetical protein
MKTKVFISTAALAVAALLISSSASFAKGGGGSNDQGTIQIGLGWLATLGGGTLKAESGGTSTSGDVTGVRGTYGLRAQYGLSENLSAGVWVRAEAATYVPSTLSLTGFSNDITYSGTSFGLEGKYYLANSEGFNFYPAIAVGYTTANNEVGGFTFGTTKYNISGINYSVGVGLNWYFVSDVFGLSVDIDYAGSSLSGTQPADSYGNAETKYTLTNGSIAWGLGLTAHFGGK